MGLDISVVLFNFSEYQSTLVPAVRSVKQTGNTQQISDLLKLTANSPFASKWADLPSLILDDYLETLSGNSHYSRVGDYSNLRETSREDMLYFVTQMCVPELLGLFIPKVIDINPEQDMSRSRLPLFLYDHSKWIEEYFTFSKEVSGAVLEYPFGEWSGLFSNDEVDEFYSVLARIDVPVADEDIREPFENLRAILRLTSRGDDHQLLMRIR